VSENKSLRTRREVKSVEMAREQLAQIGWPSNQENYEIVHDNKINNSKCSTDDIQRAEHIVGGILLIFRNKSEKITCRIASDPSEEIDIEYKLLCMLKELFTSL